MVHYCCMFRTQFVITMSLANRISAKNRSRKYQFFIDTYSPNKGQKILDVGFSDIEYSVSDNYLEKHYPHQGDITALGIDTPTQFPTRYPQVKVVQYEGRVFPFADQTFDIGWSNAVIEHVGGWQEQVLFLKEVKRTCKHGFITTPNRWFPIEVHTRIPLLHFLPKRYFDALLKNTSKAWATGSYMHLLSYKDIKKLLAEAGIEKYTIKRNRFFGFTMDFVIVF